jgi:hypothetical protein
MKEVPEAEDWTVRGINFITLVFAYVVLVLAVLIATAPMIRELLFAVQ